MYELQYVPLALPFFIFFVGLYVFLIILIQLHVLHYAYAKLGLSSGAALLVLLASLIGSYFNIPSRNERSGLAKSSNFSHALRCAARDQLA